MTREEMFEKMTTIDVSVESAVEKYNELAETESAKEHDKRLAEITENCNEFHSLMKKVVFSDCAASGNAMLSAATRLNYDTIGTKFEKIDSDGDDKKLVVIKRTRDIDIMSLHKYVDGGIGNDKNWHYAIERLNCLLTLKACVDLGIDAKTINDSYEINEAAKAYRFAEEFVPDGSKKKPKNPISNGSILNTVNEIVHMMIGNDYNASNKDVRFLNECYSKKSKKALTISVCNNKQLRQLMLEICHRIITDKDYVVESKNIKTK